MSCVELYVYAQTDGQPESNASGSIHETWGGRRHEKEERGRVFIEPRLLRDAAKNDCRRLNYVRADRVICPFRRQQLQLTTANVRELRGKRHVHLVSARCAVGLHLQADSHLQQHEWMEVLRKTQRRQHNDNNGRRANKTTHALNARAVERGVRGKLPRAPRQRRGPVIPQNEFFIATWDESSS